MEIEKMINEIKIIKRLVQTKYISLINKIKKMK